MNCPICNSEIKLTSSRLFPHFLFCPQCTGHFTEEGEAVYPEEYFIEKSVPTFLGRVFAPLLNEFFRFRLKKILAAIPREHPRVLDYGCGTGELILRLRKRGIDAVGYEPSPAAARIASATGIPVFTTTPDSRFDLVMFWHSLEHIDQPLRVLQSCTSLLAPSGKFLIAVPNAASWEAQWGRDRWFHYDFPYHRIQFTPRAIERMLTTIGFEIVSADFFNPDYTFSGLLQTWLNFFFPKNILYSAFTHRRLTNHQGRSVALAIVSLIVSAISLPFLVAIFIAAVLRKKTGAMIVTAARQKPL